MQAVCALTVLGSQTGAASPSPQSPVATESQPARYVVGLSPFLDRNVKDDVYRRITRLLLEDLPLDSSLRIYDAYHLRTIASVEVPDVAAFRSAKTRANQFKDPIRKLKEFLAGDPPATASSLDRTNHSVRLPQFMDFLSRIPGSPDAVTAVVVLGGPLYLDHQEPGFSMLDGYFPSDGHLLASRDDSVFGLQGREAALRNVVMHFGWFGDPWLGTAHRERVERFWSLYLEEQGARLATFCGDLPTVFEAARTDPARREGGFPRYELDRSHTKLEMLRITREVGLADWITRDVIPNAATLPPTRTVGPMKIGIRWKGNIDLDLYARPTGEGETLFFEHMRSPEGYYFKDHRSSPDREYEFIEFETPVDVWRAEAMVNFYEGASPGGPQGEIRIEFEDRIYTGHFMVPAERGNQGRSGRNQNRFWVRIDILAILKLSGQ